MPARKRRDLVPISAAGHGTPPPLPGPRRVVEKEPARRIAAKAHGSAGTFGDDLRRGPRHRCEQPIQAAFARDKLETPSRISLHQFVVSFGNRKNSIDGLDRVPRKRFAIGHRGEHALKSGLQAPRLREQSGSTLPVGIRKGQQFPAALVGDNACGQKEAQKIFPGEAGRRAQSVAKIDGQAAANEERRSWGLDQCNPPE